MNDKKEYDTELEAYTMLVIFESYIIHDNGGHRISDTGLAALSHYFEGVPRDERGHVFLNFLALLNQAGYHCDVSQFTGMEDQEESA